MESLACRIRQQLNGSTISSGRNSVIQRSILLPAYNPCHIAASLRCHGADGQHGDDHRRYHHPRQKPLRKFRLHKFVFPAFQSQVSVRSSAPWGPRRCSAIMTSPTSLWTLPEKANFFVRPFRLLQSHQNETPCMPDSLPGSCSEKFTIHGKRPIFKLFPFYFTILARKIQWKPSRFLYKIPLDFLALSAKPFFPATSQQKIGC